ncbi:hypothetical protein [Dongia sedimenti]|uniref:Uncharacterized protein n=1 Tax=Dongia sedimenti TaxID=3064282 RepID=A0ABU0YTU9_9PROT|nr:hypothetical protein [Rhodospirillaceae bacterium R-7]
MDNVARALEVYSQETRRYAELKSSTEATYYPVIRNLLTTALNERSLPFEIRTGTSEQRRVKGRDAPDFVLSDNGLLVSAFGEIKLPEVDLEDIAMSEDRDDQIGRYLAQTGMPAVELPHCRGLASEAADHLLIFGRWSSDS